MNPRRTALKADAQPTFADGTVGEWSGVRVTGSVNRSNGYPVFCIELFAKHPDSDTKVYSGQAAPNVLKGSRYGEEEGGFATFWS